MGWTILWCKEQDVSGPRRASPIGKHTPEILEIVLRREIVAMMQSAQTRSRRDANYGSVHCRRALGRSLLTRPQVSAILVVIGDVLSEQTPAMPLVEHDQEQDVEYSGLHEAAEGYLRGSGYAGQHRRTHGFGRLIFPETAKVNRNPQTGKPAGLGVFFLGQPIKGWRRGTLNRPSAARSPLP